MGRPIGAQNKDKPFRDALRMEQAALAKGEIIKHPEGSLRWNAQCLLMKGEIPAIREIADRLDGKVPQAIVGDDESDPIRVEPSDKQLAEAMANFFVKVKHTLRK